MERMLGKAEALGKAPYQSYKGQRIAGFDPMQEQAFQAAANLGPAQQIGTGTELAGLGGLQALGAGENYQQMVTNPGAVSRFMSPFQQNVTDIEKREAMRQAGIAGTQRAFRQAGSGSMGGYRQGIENAEANRNLMQQMGDIQARGSQSAYEQAMKNIGTGAELGLRGAGQATSAGATLGQLGQTQFGQQEAAMRAQAAAGGQRQALEQERLTQDYQDFLNQRNYQKQNIAFMADILRGAPMQQATQSTYQAQPGMAAQLGQIGLGAYGVSQMMKKEGGVIKGYASGGVTTGADPAELASMVKQLSSEQLAAMQENAEDATTLAILDTEQRRRALLQQNQALEQEVPEESIKEQMIGENAGLAALPIDQSMASQFDPEASSMMARGGIVAFAKGDKVEAPPAKGSDYYAQRLEGAVLTPLSQAEKEGITASSLAEMQKYVGPDKSVELTKELTKEREALSGEDRMGRIRGLAALEAVEALGEPGVASDLTRFGRAGGKFGRSIAAAEKADAEAKRQLLLAEISNANAQRAARMGEFTFSKQEVERAQTARDKAQGFELQRDANLLTASTTKEGQQLQADTSIRTAQISKEAALGSAEIGARSKQQEFSNQILASERRIALQEWQDKNPGKQPTKSDIAQIEKTANASAAEKVRAGYGGLPLRQQEVDLKTQKSLDERMDKWRDSREGRDAIKAAKKKDKDAGIAPDDTKNPKSAVRKLFTDKMEEFGGSPSSGGSDKGGGKKVIKYGEI
jgi:hypothetical protein